MNQPRAPWNGLPEHISFWIDMALIYLVFLPGLVWFVSRPRLTFPPL